MEKSGVLGINVTRIRRSTDVSYWIIPDHIFGEITEVVMSAANSDHEYSYKTDFETWRENQEFEHQNILMSRPPLELTLIGTSITNVTMKHLYSTTLGTKVSDLKPLLRPMHSSKFRGKAHVQDKPESGPKSSDSSSRKSGSSDNRKFIKSKSKGRDK